MVHVGSSEASFLAKRIIARANFGHANGTYKMAVRKIATSSTSAPCAKPAKALFIKGIKGTGAGVGAIGAGVSIDYIFESMLDIDFQPLIGTGAGVATGFPAAFFAGGPVGLVSYTALVAGVLAADQHYHWKW